MNRILALTLLLLMSGLATSPSFAVDAGRPTSDSSDVLIISGTVLNSQGKPIRDAELSFSLNGKQIEIDKEVSTSKAGDYKVEIALTRGMLPEGKVEVQVRKPSYKGPERFTLDRVIKERTDEHGNSHYLAHQSFRLARAITPAFWIATLILIIVYVLIALEYMHRTLAAFLGAASILTITYTIGTFNPDYTILSFEDAIHAIDMNVIFLLMAMMMIVGVLKKTGVFQWMAYKSYQLAQGNVFVLSAILMLVTAVTSAFLDNVTTMLLIIPVTIEIALTLKIDPITLLMPEVFASNVGGTATLIGDPPNIMIGSYAKLSFLDFAQNLTIICIVSLIFSIIYFVYWYKKDYLKARVGNVQEMIAQLREEYSITNRTLLIQGGVILGITIVLFIMHGYLHMEPCIAAMIGAAILMVISRVVWQ